MNNLNAVGKQREYWRVLPVMPSELLIQMAQEAEDDGINGLFAYQVYGPPFISLAAAATIARRLKIAAGIAVAASRSPFKTAMAARDLDIISGGRFILGLGSSTPSALNHFYGVPDVKLLHKMYVKQWRQSDIFMGTLICSLSLLSVIITRLTSMSMKLCRRYS